MIVNNIPSDFSVITGVKLNGEGVIALLEHDLVRSVAEDRQVSVKLQSDEPMSANPHISDSESSYLGMFQRKILSVTSRSISSLMQAPVLWRKGYKGSNVKVAVLDTGLQKSHPHFTNIMETLDFTGEDFPSDTIGHGTFVCGVIASSRDCLGLAPNAEIYSLKVFNSQQISHTSWFLDAFNYALHAKVDILNLSIGGPDFMDNIFVEKVMELSSKGVIFISAMGNDGPLYGTLNNPADQLDVIGVGGINYDDEIADFSSRGMTMWELPLGYGRVKPDIVTYGTAIRGSSMKGSCRYLTGTSVSSPVVAGAVALLTEIMKKNERLSRVLSPASIKQVLMASAQKLPGTNMFEQGSGKINLMNAYRILQGYVPQVTVSPPSIDWTDCPYMWPYCSQPMYYTAMPQIVNLTITNGMSVRGSIETPPTWHPNPATSGHFLDIYFTYNTNLWPWSGYLGIIISVNEAGANWAGTVEGYVLLTITSPPTEEDIYDQVSTVSIPLKVNIIPTPPRYKRILWDQFHSLGYPLGPFPRDNLKANNAPLDWNGDHIHTNFNGLYTHLRSKGYFVETLQLTFHCFDAMNYGHFLLVDPEDDYFPDEIEKLRNDVNIKRMNLIVFADWYNGPLIKHIKFFDENTKQWVVPQGGGSNIPALNKLLSYWDILLGDKVWRGPFTLGRHAMEYGSGTSIISFPKTGQIITADLVDEGLEMLISKKQTVQGVPILGTYRPTSASGSVTVYGDSNCLDSVHKPIKCYWMLEEILQLVTPDGSERSLSITAHLKTPDLGSFRYPKVASTQLFHKYSRVVTNIGGHIQFRTTPLCPIYKFVEHKSYNDTYPIGQLNTKLLSLESMNDEFQFIDSEFETSMNVFYALGFVVIVSVMIVIGFLYSVYSMFHKKRIVLHKHILPRRRV